MANDFVHLHVHSEYSMLDGLGRIKELVKETKRLGQTALALTDHGVMHGAIEFFRACKENEIKPIIGIEAYQTVWGRPMGGRDGQLDRENYHLLLLAKNMTGYRNLLKIASHSQLNGYYYRPRVDHEFLAKHAEGLVCTTGCLGAEVPQLLMQGKEQEAYDRFGWYVDVFGKENFYIELQEHSIPELIPVNKSLVPWSEKFGIGLLATNDVHYVKEADADPHEMLLCVQTGESIKSEKRMRLSDQSYFLKSREQMEATFRPFIDLPASAFDNSLLIRDMCEVDLEDKNYHLPDMEIPEGYTYDTYLRHLTEEGLVRLYGERAHNEDVQKRKDFELGVIAKMGFSIYFLIVADLCRFARTRNIWWNVRGSGAGSLVAYCTGITGIDPLKNNLIFERFLNPARVTMPDFDLDFPDDQREEMIRYTIEKYGKEQVAQIVTFGRMKARAAIKDVGRAQEIPLNQVNRIAQLIPAIPGKPVLIKDVMTEGHEFYNPELVQLYQNEPWVTSLLDYSMKLEGVTRHSGIHAAAVIVADKELVHYAPLMRPSKGSVTETVAQFEFPILESIGLLKVDFLGLSTLSVMREAGRLIKERHGIEYTLATIPFEGEVTTQAFKLLSSGEVSGVFQVESAGMRRVLTEMRPHLFEHIVATISLYRPGPLEYIPNYIRRLHGEEEIEFKHDALKPILTETLGIIIYQEQIIQVLNRLAGYSPGEADLVRRAISKKKASDIEKHKKIFVEGCAKNNIPKDAAEAIYGDIEFFARYGFNKCLPGDVEVLNAATGRLVKVEDLYTGAARIETTLACDIDALKLRPGAVSAVMNNGVKPVYRLTTTLGRTIEATDNHPFYTFDGWRLLEELHNGEQIAVPRRIPIEGKQAWAADKLVALAALLAEGVDELPAEIFGLNNQQLELLVRSIWDFRTQASGVFHSARLARQLQHILLRLGLVARVQSVSAEHCIVTIEEDQPIAIETVPTAFHLLGMLPEYTRTNILVIDRDNVHQRTNDIYWDKIVSIEYVGEKQTYDLEVPGLHNFIANDILVHNSHAADYAVITVQTAFLKAHYPVEYMAALLLIERDKTEKVVNFINECRRMGISVLPPDVNYSGLDFEIQSLPDGVEAAKPDPMLSFKFPVPPGSAIRFGMAAVKMVGEGPVKEILAARNEGGPFASLEEFADRVDLRKVGKRPIECLIKVGAFDRFGKRNQLLAVIDQMVANSGSVHDQRASGQLSMFDLFAGGAASVAQIRLPNVEEVKGREKLTWEKELLGVYAASHPMQSLGIDMSKIVTCYCNELSEEHNGKNVTLAGMITSVRTINTKKGDQMAFVQLEDRQGQCEAVVFPRAYQELKEKLVPDSLVIMKGKAQTREGQTSLLVDSIQNYVDQAVAVGGEESNPYQRPLVEMTPTFNGLVINEANADYVATVSDGFVMGDEDDFSPPPQEEDPFRNDMPEWLRSAEPEEPMEALPPKPAMPVVKPPTATTTKQNNATTGTTANATPESTIAAMPPTNPPPATEPPPPPATPEGGKRVSITGALTPVVSPTANGQEHHAQSNGHTNGAQANGKAEQPKPGQAKAAETPPAPPATQTVEKAEGPKAAPGNGAPNRPKPAPTGAPTNGNGQGSHRNGRQTEGQSQRANERRLHITFRRSGDLERDKYRLKEIYDRVRDPRGRDRFFIVLESNGQRYELAFPNDPCSISDRLVGELTKHFRVDVTVDTEQAVG
ncbi:MAG: DNA polymerase III subunit alpha [Caldilinea sp. CFX5]|nr:DNA polymerase III subunit alpha [Caldilinea sp. CFX5]